MIDTKFRLKTLDEHRYATRFDPKIVTPQTWPRALRKALKKLRHGDRIQHVEALYMLLEVADLRPRGCDLGRVWLNIGSIYVVFSHLDEAVRAYHQCLHFEPTQWKAHFNLGVALARQRVFALAKTEFEHALVSQCPQDAVERIHELMEAIDTIQSRRNEHAYKETNDARAFTWRYLETLHLLATTREASSGSRLVKPGLPPPPNAPLLFDIATGWNGPLASFLHDLHVHASLHNVFVYDEYKRLEENKTGSVSLGALETLYRRLCGNELPQPAKAALGDIFIDKNVMVRLLVPNAETLQVIDEMQRVGYFYAGMSWRLTKRRLCRSKRSRIGGLWRWLECSLEAWCRELVNRLHLPKKEAARYSDILTKLGYATPMHFAVRGARQPSHNLSGVPENDQHRLEHEIDHAVSAIRDESCRVLQMFFRRLRISRRKELTVLNRHKRDDHSADKPGCLHLSGATVAIHEEKEVTRSVLETLDDLVEAVVSSVRAETYARITIPAGAAPVRTENRHRLD